MSARYCYSCNVEWPAQGWVDTYKPEDRKVSYEFDPCPICEEETELRMMTGGIPRDEVRRRVGEHRFNEFYELWEQERDRRGDPSPDALGRLEAKQIAELNGILSAGEPNDP